MQLIDGVTLKELLRYDEMPADRHYGQGPAYEHTRPNGGWQTTTETAKLTVPNGNVLERLGVTVTALADTIIAGAKGSES
jgi:hypothetical protein